MAIKSGKEGGVSNELNLVGKGTRIEGDIYTDSSIRIAGKIKGKVICKNTLTLGEHGEIKGEVEAANAIIGGKIEGKLNVKEKLVLESRSSFIGELKARRLIVDEGALFEGTSSMGSSAQQQAEPAKVQPT